MANPTTDLDPGVATTVANQHRSTGDSVGQQQNNFNSAVDMMDDACDGAMLRALMTAKEQWSKELHDVIADLNEMAGNVDGSVGDIGQQDVTNAGGIGKVGMDILRGI